MTFALKDNAPKKCGYEEALNLTGFGKYNLSMLGTCCLLIMAMYFDIFGFSVAMPAVACDMALSTSQQGLLSAVPLIGVMISSYGWGLCADTLGRRRTLLIAMPLGVIFNFAASMAPNYASLAVLKFFSASFTSSANAAAFVLMGETVERGRRGSFMFLMASSTMVTQMFICLFALPIFQNPFSVALLWGSEYRPWRLLMQVITLPGLIGIPCVFLMWESPKFLLSKGRNDEAMEVLKTIYSWNTGHEKLAYPVTTVFLDEITASSGENKSIPRRMWDQTAPLFKPPLLKNSAKLYYILLCAYMTSTGYTMWVPTMTNAYFDGEDSSGLTFCEVASKSASGSSNSTSADCDDVIATSTLYATMIYSFISGVLGVSLSYLVTILGKKRSTLLVFIITSTCGVLLLFVKIPYLSIALFFGFLYVALILGNVNTYLVELNPTHLRGMATCLSVVVARGFGFFSVQIIAALLADHCTPMIISYVVLVLSGLAVAIFLPPGVKSGAGDIEVQNDNTNGTQVPMEKF